MSAYSRGLFVLRASDTQHICATSVSQLKCICHILQTLLSLFLRLNCILLKYKIPSTNKWPGIETTAKSIFLVALSKQRLWSHNIIVCKSKVLTVKHEKNNTSRKAFMCILAGEGGGFSATLKCSLYALLTCCQLTYFVAKCSSLFYSYYSVCFQSLLLCLS